MKWDGRERPRAVRCHRDSGINKAAFLLRLPKKWVLIAPRTSLIGRPAGDTLCLQRVTSQMASSPPRHASGTREVFYGGLPYYRFCVSFNCCSSRFSWLHSQAVQRCGSGFWGAVSSTHVLVSGTGTPRISHISAYAAYQGGLVVSYSPGRPVITPKIGHWSVSYCLDGVLYLE